MNTHALTHLLSSIDPGSDFTVDGIIAQIRVELQRAMTGGLSRSDFERKLFAFENLADLPLGHLLDHRVRMPEEVVSELLGNGRLAVSRLFENMLCSVPHRQAASMVGGALRCEPSRDAFELMELYAAHPTFIRHCIAGYHGDAVSALPKAPAEERRRLVDLLARASTYYGALEVQLIAARQKAIEEYRFAIDNGQMTNTMGSLLDELRRMVAVVQRAKIRVDTGRNPRGPNLHLLARFEDRQEELLSNPFVTESGLSVDGMVAQLQDLYAWIGPIADAIDAVLNKVPKDGDGLAGASNKTSVDSADAKLREMITTAYAGGVTAGQQIAFASMRLCAFANELPNKIARLASGKKMEIQKWFGPLPARKLDAASRLCLVNRAIVWGDNTYGEAFPSADRQLDLESVIKVRRGYGITLGEDLLKGARDAAPAWKRERLTCLGAPALSGPQRWDILPEYRYEFVRSKAPEPLAKIPARPDDLKENQPSPSYRAPLIDYR